MLDLDAIREREAERPYCSYIRSLRVILTPKERDALVGRIQELCAERETFSDRINELEQSLQATRNALTGTQQVRDDYKARAVEAKAERDEMQKRLDFHFGHAVESWKEEVASLEAERDTLRAALDKIKHTAGLLRDGEWLFLSPGGGTAVAIWKIADEALTQGAGDE